MSSPTTPSDTPTPTDPSVAPPGDDGTPTPKPMPRPVHPMPVSFPELYLPTETRLPRQNQPIPVIALPTTTVADPHNIHDGHGGYSPEHVVCVRCGSSNLAQGQVVDYGDRFRNVLFAPKRVSLNWLNSLLAVLPFRSLAKMNALACRDCGFVQLTVEPSELRRVERRRDK